MPERESFSNIFDAAGKSSKKPPPKTEEPAVEVKEKMSDEELKTRFDRCTELHNLIQDKLEKAFSEHNVTQKQMRDFFDSPQHFSTSEWRLIQEQKDEIATKLKQLVPEVRASLKAAHDKSKEKKPKSMQTKSRWMPMR